MNTVIVWGLAGLTVLGIGAVVVRIMEQLAEPAPGRIYDEARISYNEWYSRYGIEVRDENA